MIELTPRLLRMINPPIFLYNLTYLTWILIPINNLISLKPSSFTYLILKT